MAYALRSKVDTWLKLRPVQSATLSERERTFLKANLLLPLAAYRTVGDHLLITLGKTPQGQQLSMGGRNTWYIYQPVAEIVSATVIPSPPPPAAPAAPRPTSPPPSPDATAAQGYALRIKSTTWFKASTAQASTLPATEKALVKEGQDLPLAAYQVVGNHLRITLGQTPAGQQLFMAGRNTWYVYLPAVEVIRDNDPLDLTSKPKAAPTPVTSGGAIPRVGIELIKEFEGYAERLPDDRARAYPDPIHGWGVPTIGYGTIEYPDGTAVRQGDIITRSQAEAYLVDHVDKSTRPFLEKIPTWPRMSENRRGALYSFAYNLGAAFYGGPDFTSITRVCDSPDRWGDLAWVTEQFVKYRNPGSAAEAGLRRRREAEARLFAGG